MWYVAAILGLIIAAFVLMAACALGKFLGFNDDYNFSDIEPEEDTRNWQKSFEQEMRK